MSVSEEDLGGFASTDFDAFSEIGYDGHPDFSGYDSPSASQPVNQNYNTASYAPGGAGWYDLWGRRTDGLTNGLFDAPQDSGGTVRDITRIGTGFPSAGWLGDAIAGVAEGRGVGWENPTTGSLHSNAPTDVTQDMTKVGVGFNQMPQSIRDNISGLINPTGQQIAAMHDKAAQGQQYAHKGVSPNDFHAWVDKSLGVEGSLPPDDSKKNDLAKGIDKGVDAVGGLIGDVGKIGAGLLWKGGEALWDGLTTEQADKADPVEPSVGNTLTPQTDSDLFQSNLARYNSLGPKAYNTGPLTKSGATDFSPGRWDAYENYKPPTAATSGADNIARILSSNIQLDPSKMYANLNNQATDALTYEDRNNMSNEQIAEMLGIQAESYEAYGQDEWGGVFGAMQDMHKPVYSYEDKNLIDLFKMKGFDAEDLKHLKPSQQNIKGGGQTSIGLPSSFKDEPLLSVTPGIDLMGLGVVGLGAALSKVGIKDGFDFIAKHGLDNWNTFKKAVMETDLAKKARQPVDRSDDILTVTEQGMMKPVVRNKTGLGKNTPDELGTINRNTPIQGENVFTNSQILAKRNQLGPKGTPVNVHLQPTKGTPRDLGAGSFGAKGAAAEDTRNMLRALKTEAKNKGPNKMAADKRKKAKIEKAKAKANKKRR